VFCVIPAFDADFLQRCTALRANPRADAWVGIDGVRTSWHFTPSDGRRSAAILSAELLHPLDIDLRVRLAGVIESNQGPYATGNERFDGLFAVRAAAGNLEAVRHLLDSRATDDLCALAETGEPILADRRLSIGIATLGLDENEFAILVRRVVDLTLHLASRVEDLPTPAALRTQGVAPRVQSFAEQYGLTVRPNALVAFGGIPSSRFEIAFHAHAEHSLPWCSLWLRFDEPLGIGLSLRPADFGDRAREWIGRGDLHLGDSAFDAAWTIRAHEESGAHAILHEDARSLITTLAEAGVVLSLSDAGLDGHITKEISADAVTTVLQACERLRETLRPRSGSGPYRS
jgi:hypothetical protein